MDMFIAKGAFSGFSVKDLEKTKKFYHAILGLKVSEEHGMGLQLHLPGGGVVFVYEKANHTPATFTILNLVVENIDAAVDALVEKGIHFERYEDFPFKQDEKGIARGIAAKMGPDIAWFTDPSGNIVSVIQEK